MDLKMVFGDGQQRLSAERCENGNLNSSDVTNRDYRLHYQGVRCPNDTKIPILLGADGGRLVWPCSWQLDSPAFHTAEHLQVTAGSNGALLVGSRFVTRDLVKILYVFYVAQSSSSTLSTSFT